MTLFRRSTLHQSKSDRILQFCTQASALFAASIVLCVIAFLLFESWPALRQIGIARFFTDAGWHPLSSQFNLLPMLAATLALCIGALLIATPLGICSALFVNFYAPNNIAKKYRQGIQLLAGIPSVVFGLWGLIVLAPMIAKLGGSGQNLLTATIVLAIMILPTIALSADAAISSLPPALIHGAAALGLGNWAIASRVALPAARRQLSAGLLLATTRAIGETMAVLMVAGNVVQTPNSLLDSVRSLPANIALEMGYATHEHRSVLFVSGLLLLCFVFAAAVAAFFLNRKGPYDNAA